MYESYLDIALVHVLFTKFSPDIFFVTAHRTEKFYRGSQLRHRGTIIRCVSTTTPTLCHCSNDFSFKCHSNDRSGDNWMVKKIPLVSILIGIGCHICDNIETSKSDTQYSFFTHLALGRVEIKKNYDLEFLTRICKSRHFYVKKLINVHRARTD